MRSFGSGCYGVPIIYMPKKTIFAKTKKPQQYSSNSEE